MAMGIIIIQTCQRAMQLQPCSSTRQCSQICNLSCSLTAAKACLDIHVIDLRMHGSCRGSNNLSLPDSELHCHCRKLSLWVTVCWHHSKTRHPVHRLLVHVPLLLKIARRPQHKQCKGSEMCKLVPKSWLFVGTLMLTWL